MDGPQQISGTYGKQEFVMDAWVKADQDGIDMALFNSFGAGMGELGFQDGEVSFTSGIFPSSLPGEYIIADFQLCFYKAEAVRKNLAAAGLKFKRELQMEQVEVRGVFAGKKEIIRIEKNAETVKYVNFLRGYSYTLRGDF
jgi:hypothetical protein